MNQPTPFLHNSVYKFLFALLGIVYVFGLFVPLMDNDSSHHANIALHMYLTGDYVSLVDYGKDYLDKPHLHFWLCAFSYKIFGVNTFAYKLPSFLFTILGTYSTYKLGSLLYNKEVGKLSSLIVASAFAYMLANNDVRMDAILTACIAFATWQLIAFIQTNKFINIAGAALGLALGFSTKGHIAVFTPAVGVLFYLLYKKYWKLLLNWRWFLLVVLFFVFISPVVYCYYLQYNLHPEKIVRDKDHINGVKFILFGQSVERFKGDSFGSDAKNDYFFFFHSFLWAFAPWSILAYIALFGRLKTFFKRKYEWLTPATIIIIGLIVSFSGFKLPHYLNIIFPVAAVLTASWIIENAAKAKTIFIIQSVIIILLLLLSVVVNVWFFPVTKMLIIIGVILFLAVVIYFWKSTMYSLLQKAVTMSVATMAFSFFLLNTNFYPQLLTYQAGNELAKQIKGKVDPASIYFWKDTYSSSFNFYTKSIRHTFNDSVFTKQQPVYLLVDARDIDSVKAAGYHFGNIYKSRDYEITKLQLKFVNPSTREKELTALQVVELKK